MSDIPIKLVVGLGNPGSQYAGTRHNIGWLVLDKVAKRLNVDFAKARAGSALGETRVNDSGLVLMKPLTYMNLSGEPLSRFLKNRPIPPVSILMICDDIHLPLGKIRLRSGGSDGGHNGLKSISQHLHTKDYPRLRFGVGSPPLGVDQIDYVLGKLSGDETSAIADSLDRAADAVLAWVESGIEQAMNQYNG